MTDEKWHELVGRIKDECTVLEERTEPIDDGPGERGILVFSNPRGTMKLERIVRPILLGTKAIGSKRMGSSATVIKEYSETESSASVHLSVQQGDAWIPVDVRVAFGG